MEITLPKIVTVNACIYIYLLLSICIVNVYATNKPVPHTKLNQNQNGESETNEGGVNTRTTRSVVLPPVLSSSDSNGWESERVKSKYLTDRSLDTYDEYSLNYENSFSPSVQLSDETGYNKYGIRVGDRIKSKRPRTRQRKGGKRRRLPQRNRKVSYTYDNSVHNSPLISKNYNTISNYGEPYNSYSQLYKEKSPARNSYTEGRFPSVRPEPSLSIHQDVVSEHSTTTKNHQKPGILGSFLKLLGSKKLKISPERITSESNEPSYEFIYNDQDIEDKATLAENQLNNLSNGLFIPSNGDYDDYNLNYIDDEDGDTYAPDYDFKDVLHSIRNNESRIITLKKFLSAASGMTDRAGTDPAFMLFNMPITILAILGVFYAVSAVAVLGYKYLLLTTGNSNGAAVALIPVAVIFAIPLVLATIFLFIRGSVDGQINIGQLARGDLNRVFRPDFDSVDFAYDLAVGSSALLGLGWIVSVAL